MKENQGMVLVLVLFDVSHLVAVKNVTKLLGTGKRGHPVFFVVTFFQDFSLDNLMKDKIVRSELIDLGYL